MRLILRAALAALPMILGSAEVAHAACVDPFTMLESAEMRAEQHGGAATLIEGPHALRIADAVNHTGKPTSFRADQLVIWTEPDAHKTSVAFVLAGCGTGEIAVLSGKAFAAVAAKAYPKEKVAWRPL